MAQADKFLWTRDTYVPYPFRVADVIRPPQRGQGQKRGRPIRRAERFRIARLVRDEGEARAAERLGVDRRTLARAIAGLPLYPGTIALLQQGLARSE